MVSNFKKFVRPHQTLQMIIGGALLPIIVLGWFFPLVGFSILICMFAGIFVSLRNGRQWCDYACPRGSFLDFYMTRFSPQKIVPRWFYSYWFRLSFIALLFSFLGFNIYRAWPNIDGIAFAFVKTLTITTVLAIVLAIFFRARAWCILCPVGTFSGLIGGKKNSLLISSDKCINCTKCAAVCPMGLAPYKDKACGVLQSRDCLKCQTCVMNCPTKALCFKKDKEG